MQPAGQRGAMIRERMPVHYPDQIPPSMRIASHAANHHRRTSPTVPDACRCTSEPVAGRLLSTRFRPDFDPKTA